jgi:hypothetical protein
MVLFIVTASLALVCLGCFALAMLLHVVWTRWENKGVALPICILSAIGATVFTVVALINLSVWLGGDSFDLRIKCSQEGPHVHAQEQEEF